MKSSNQGGFRVHRPFRTSLAWHLAGLVVKGFGAIMKEVWRCLK